MHARKYFQSGDLTLSYLDFHPETRSEKILLMLHGHMNDARTFSSLAARLGDEWRVFGLDQRGHGWSGHPADKDYTRESYVTDIRNFIVQELGGKPVTLLGHSLGGVNAYQFAAWHPELANAVIVEDIGVEIQADLSFAARLPERSASFEELRLALQQAGVRAIDYFSESVFEDERGWGFRSDLQGMPVSQRNISGVWWEDWLASTCPILLIHGQKSFALDLRQAEEMAARRPNIQLVLFPHCGHGVHRDDPEGYYQAVKGFLDGLQLSQ